MTNDEMIHAMAVTLLREHLARDNDEDKIDALLDSHIVPPTWLWASRMRQARQIINTVHNSSLKIVQDVKPVAKDPKYTIDDVKPHAQFTTHNYLRLVVSRVYAPLPPAEQSSVMFKLFVADEHYVFRDLPMSDFLLTINFEEEKERT